ncbi:hypothetical protein [Fructobacillus fructosus]|uniref:hypothetical protein n=1 Tax=Fructobacillus fructosus TaxID=1631 RepID=UPI001658AE86|nr:hypothetical protein [Fructobacillus fructosus]MBC9119384.1 hypothetical protein [Fructobacillus fructosus]MBD9366843.1 hypothetical protein [Leuconostoc mesenteroides]
MSFGKMFNDVLTIEKLYNNICQQLTSQYIIEVYPPIYYRVGREDSESEELEQMTNNLKSLQVSIGYILSWANMSGFFEEEPYMTNRVEQFDTLNYQQLIARSNDEAELMIDELLKLNGYLVKNNLIREEDNG